MVNGSVEEELEEKNEGRVSEGRKVRRWLKGRVESEKVVEGEGGK